MCKGWSWRCQERTHNPSQVLTEQDKGHICSFRSSPPSSPVPFVSRPFIFTSLFPASTQVGRLVVTFCSHTNLKAYATVTISWSGIIWRKHLMISWYLLTLHWGSMSWNQQKKWRLNHQWSTPHWHPHVSKVDSRLGVGKHGSMWSIGSL